ncbi:MAG: MmcQ/YjbR family DNA-binding protein [Robiginitomaculum sp.]|nr:MmcQ/YjbR family DNA-binding protein [Robiginitomaculum sp.]
MRYDEFNQFCASLTTTHMVFQWGGSYVWKVDRKVFAVGGWEATEPAFVFKASDLVYELLQKRPGVRPAPYFAARGMKWLQHFAAPGLDDDELKDYLRQSHHLASRNLSKKKRLELGLETPLV